MILLSAVVQMVMVLVILLLAVEYGVGRGGVGVGDIVVGHDGVGVGDIFVGRGGVGVGVCLLAVVILVIGVGTRGSVVDDGAGRSGVCGCLTGLGDMDVDDGVVGGSICGDGAVVSCDVVDGDGALEFAQSVFGCSLFFFHSSSSSSSSSPPPSSPSSSSSSPFPAISVG